MPGADSMPPEVRPARLLGGAQGPPLLLPFSHAILVPEESLSAPADFLSHPRESSPTLGRAERRVAISLILWRCARGWRSDAAVRRYVRYSKSSAMTSIHRVSVVCCPCGA